MTARTAAISELARKVRENDAFLLPSVTKRQAIRSRARVTIRQAAAACGVAPMTFLRWESGAAEPRQSNAAVYREFLDALTTAVKS